MPALLRADSLRGTRESLVASLATVDYSASLVVDRDTSLLRSQVNVKPTLRLSGMLPHRMLALFPGVHALNPAPDQF
jgi:hypothetical protein